MKGLEVDVLTCYTLHPTLKDNAKSPVQSVPDTHKQQSVVMPGRC